MPNVERRMPDGSVPSLLRNNNGPAEGLQVQDGAAVAVGAVQRAAADAAAGGEGEVVAANLAGESGGVHLEPGVAGEQQAHVAREAVQLVAAVLRQRAGERNVAAGGRGGDTLRLDVFELEVPADRAAVDAPRADAAQDDVAADARGLQRAVSLRVDDFDVAGDRLGGGDARRAGDVQIAADGIGADVAADVSDLDAAGDRLHGDARARRRGDVVGDADVEIAAIAAALVIAVRIVRLHFGAAVALGRV